MRTAVFHNFLIEATIMSNIAIVLMMILRKTMRRQLGNSAICFGWLLVAARLLLPISFSNPLIHSIRSPFAADAAIRPIAGQILVRTRDAINAADDFLWRAGSRVGGDITQHMISSIDYGTAGLRLMQIYIIGAALILGWFIFSNVRFRMKLRAGQIEPISGKLLAQYEAMCKERGVKPVPVIFTDPLPSACLVGVIRPYIALPLTASPADAIHVLTHEVCHLKNHDHLWSLLRLVCCVVHWFNPLVWIAAEMSRTDTELRCDDRVVKPMNAEQRKNYANILVLAAARKNAPGVAVLATGMTMTGKKLKTRVLTVLKGKEPLRWLTITFTVLASMCLVCAFATSEMPGKETGTQWDSTNLTSQLIGYPTNRAEDIIAATRNAWILLGHEDSNTLIYTTVRDEDIGTYSGLIRDNSEQCLFYCQFDSKGHIIELSQFPEEVTNAFEPYDDLGDLDAYKPILLEMLESVNPGISARISSIVFTKATEIEGGHYYLCEVSSVSSAEQSASLNVIITNDGIVQLVSMSFIGNG